MKIKPGCFEQVDEFAAYCREVVRRYGPCATLEIRWSGAAPKRGRKEVGLGLFADHLWPCPHRKGWQIYRVNAQAFSDCVDRGGMIGKPARRRNTPRRASEKTP